MPALVPEPWFSLVRGAHDDMGRRCQRAPGPGLQEMKARGAGLAQVAMMWRSQVPRSPAFLASVQAWPEEPAVGGRRGMEDTDWIPRTLVCESVLGPQGTQCGWWTP